MSILVRSEPPISKLTDDLLYQIFVSLSSNWLDSKEHHSWACGNLKHRTRHAVAAVCHHWHDIILATGQYWSFIRVDEETTVALVQAHIDRSRSSPLRINFCEHCPHCIRFDQDFRTFTKDLENDEEAWPVEYGDRWVDIARLLSAHADRIKSLFIGGSHTFTLIRRILAQFTLPAPQLQYLGFFECLVPSFDAELWESPFSGDIPQLRVLRTHETIIPWQSYSSNLTTLQFQFQSTEMPLARLTTVLGHWPHMRILDLDFLHAQVAEDSQNPLLAVKPQDRIEFPYLEKLTITSRYDRSFMQLLSRLTFPSSTKAKLALTYDDEPTTLPLCNSLFRELLEPSKKAEVDVYHWEFVLLAGCSSNLVIQWRNREPHRECELGGRLCRPGFHNLCESLGRVSLPSLESLKITLFDNGSSECQHENTIASLWNSLRATPSIASLSVQYESESYSRHCQFFETFWGPSLDAHPNVTSIQVSCVRYDIDVTLKQMSVWLLARLQRNIPQFVRLEVYAHVEDEWLQLEELGLGRIVGCEVVIKRCLDPHPQRMWGL